MARARKPTISKRHPWLQPSKEALAFAALLNAKAPESQNGIALRPVDPSLPPQTVAWRKKILKGEPLFTVKSRTRGVYTSTVSLLPSVETVYADPTLNAAGYPVGPAIGKILRGYDAVRCPSCDTAIPLRKWWEHGCKRPLTGRDASECLGSFEELTKGAAAPVYEDEEPTAPVSIPVPELDDPEIRWRAMFPGAFQVLESLERMAA